MSAEPHWWIWKEHRGEPVVRGYYNSPEEANRMGLRDLGNDFEVIQIDTTDMDKATRVIKDIRLQRTHSLDIALRRASHQPIPFDEGRKGGL